MGDIVFFKYDVLAFWESSWFQEGADPWNKLLGPILEKVDFIIFVLMDKKDELRFQVVWKLLKEWAYLIFVVITYLIIALNILFAFDDKLFWNVSVLLVNLVK